MKALKWDFENSKYNRVDIPERSSVFLEEKDWDKKIQCAECGEEIEYALSFGSRCLHNDRGFCYHVCPECFRQEIEKERKAFNKRG